MLQPLPTDSPAGGSLRRRGHFAENTLLSLIKASAAGADAVEFDVQLTRDGFPVIHHDWGVATVLGGVPQRIPVGHMTLEAFKRVVPLDMRNGPEMSEGGIARRADAAALAPLMVVKDGGGGGGGGHPTPTPSLLRRANAMGLEMPFPLLSPPPPPFVPLSDHCFATLAELLLRVPIHTGFNVEVKYPTPAEAAAFGLTPLDRCAYVDRIVACVEPLAEGRGIMYSSFDPDVCWMLAAKQAAHPVFFLTEGGTHTDAPPDYRWASLAGAVAFALEAGLAGVVTDVTPLIAAPSLIGAIQATGLALASYGRRNNEDGVVAMQVAAGLHAVICDHVRHVVEAVAARRASQGRAAR